MNICKMSENIRKEGANENESKEIYLKIFRNRWHWGTNKKNSNNSVVVSVLESEQSCKKISETRKGNIRANQNFVQRKK